MAKKTPKLPSKPATLKLVTATTPASKPTTTGKAAPKLGATPAKPAIAPKPAAPAAAKPAAKQLSGPGAAPAVSISSIIAPVNASIPAPAADKPATDCTILQFPKARVTYGGAVNRAATLPQLYGADAQLPRDEAYARFYASFLRGKPATTVITYAEISERQKPAQFRCTYPGAGGKNGCLDRGILSRLEKLGVIVNASDPTDTSRRNGFAFTTRGLALACVQAGMRDTYIDGRPVTK